MGIGKKLAARRFLVAAIKPVAAGSSANANAAPMKGTSVA
jgi:hypothetical protein